MPDVPLDGPDIPIASNSNKDSPLVPRPPSWETDKGDKGDPEDYRG